MVSPGRGPATEGALSLMSWNIHYGVGRPDDRGALRDEVTVRGVLAGIAAVVKRHNPDILCLQEVDFDSRRTHHIDQADFLAQALNFPYQARVETWRVGYLPYPSWPPSQHYGAMRSGQVVLSRYPIEVHEVFGHPKPPSNPWWYNLFYLRRTTQRLVVDLGAGRRLALFNIHLEAFDGRNREAQAREVNALAREVRSRGMAVVLMGDFNAIPAAATLRKAFPDEPETDMTDDTTISRVLAGTGLSDILARAVGVPDGPGLWSFPSMDPPPNRRLDYILAPEEWTVVESSLVTDDPSLSDHLAVRALLVLPQSGG